MLGWSIPSESVTIHDKIQSFRLSQLSLLLKFLFYRYLVPLKALKALNPPSQAVAGALPYCRRGRRLRQVHVGVAQPQKQRRRQDAVVDENTWGPRPRRVQFQLGDILFRYCYGLKLGCQ